MGPTKISPALFSAALIASLASLVAGTALASGQALSWGLPPTNSQRKASKCPCGAGAPARLSDKSSARRGQQWCYRASDEPRQRGQKRRWRWQRRRLAGTLGLAAANVWWR